MEGTLMPLRWGKSKKQINLICYKGGGLECEKDILVKVLWSVGSGH